MQLGALKCLARSLNIPLGLNCLFSSKLIKTKVMFQKAFNKGASSFFCILKPKARGAVCEYLWPAFGGQPPSPSPVPEAGSEMWKGVPLSDS